MTMIALAAFIVIADQSLARESGHVWTATAESSADALLADFVYQSLALSPVAATAGRLPLVEYAYSRDTHYAHR